MDLEVKRLTHGDMSDYLKIKNEYEKDEALLALAVGDFEDMPFVYLKYMLVSIVDEDRNRLRLRNSPQGSKNYPTHFRVSDVYESIGRDELHNRLTKLMLVTANKAGVEVAKQMKENHPAVCRRVSTQILGDIKSVLNRFYYDITDRGNIMDKAFLEFQRVYKEEVGSISDKDEYGLTTYLMEIFYGNVGSDNYKLKKEVLYDYGKGNA